jgi:hypothetical protein
MLLASWVTAGAEATAQPVRPHGKCSVRVEENWKPQERFVWRQVCVGKTANFNEADGYGGALDPTAARGFPANRILSSAFIEAILLKGVYRRALTRNGVRIIGARLTETLKLNDAELGHELWLDGSMLEKGVDFSGLRSMHPISFERSKVLGVLRMERLQLSSSLYMGNKAEFADVLLRNARISEQIDLNDAKVTGALNMDGVQVGSLNMSGEFAEMILESARVDGLISLNGARVTGKLNMNSLKVGASLFMRAQAEFAEVDLGSAHVGGVIDLNSAKVTRELNMDSVQVGSTLFMGDKAEFGEVNLANAHVDGQIGLNSAKVTGKLTMNGLQVGASLFMRDRAEFAAVDLGSAHVGGVIDFNSAKVTSELNMDGVQIGSLNLSGEFAEVILSGAHVDGQIGLNSAKVTGKLNMNSLKVGASLFMNDRAEFAAVDLGSAHVGSVIDLNSAKVTGELNMSGLQVGFLGMSGEFAEVNLANAHVDGLISLNSAKVTGKLNMNGLQTGASLFMRDGAEFAAVDLGGAHVGGVIDLNNAKVTGKLSMPGLQVGFLGMSGEFAEVNLANAHVDGLISLNSAKVTGKLTMNGLQVGTSLFMRDRAEFAEVDLGGAHVGGVIDLNSAKVTGKLSMRRLQVGSSLSMSKKAEFAEVILVGAHVGGSFELIDSKVSGDLDGSDMEIGQSAVLGDGTDFFGTVNLAFSKVKNLELSGGAFHKNGNITGMQIAGELQLGSSRREPAKWSEASTLILRNARADVIQDLRNAWPNELDLNGFTYRSLGGLDAANDSMAERPAEWFKDWLEKQKRYAPAPYEQLAAVLHSQGRPDVADDILFANSERKRSLASLPNYVLLTVAKGLIGYGYHIWWALFWVALFLTIGMTTLRISGEGRKHGMPIGVAYSFDMLLPIIQLRKFRPPDIANFHN